MFGMDVDGVEHFAILRDLQKKSGRPWRLPPQDATTFSEFVDANLTTEEPPRREPPHPVASHS